MAPHPHLSPDDKCRCKHERKWHNACSKCACPFFMAAPAKGDIEKAWRAARAIRQLREGID